MAAGEYKERIQFEQRAEDENGDRLGDWETADRWKVRARFTWLRGGESVTQSRLTGVNVVVMRVRTSEAMREVTSAFRVVDRLTGATFNIRSAIPVREHRAIDFTCETGGADG